MRQHGTNTLRSEYDFSRGVRGRHHKGYLQNTKVVVATTCATHARNDSVTSREGRRPVTQVTRHHPKGLRDS